MAKAVGAKEPLTQTRKRKLGGTEERQRITGCAVWQLPWALPLPRGKAALPEERQWLIGK